MAPALFPLEFRTIDGSLNNPVQTAWGATGAELLRVTPVAYADGTGSPAGQDRESARLISNLVAAQEDDQPNPLGLSDFVWQWGQFVDHDIDETPIAEPPDETDIPVPAGDPWFDPFNTGAVTIPFDRSAYHMVNGVRQQLNNITAYIDASNVYGSDEDRALELRTLDGTGRLRTSDGDLLPFNVNGYDNAPSPAIPTFFLAGDIRANEQVGLTAMHTLFVREHNFWAENVGSLRPGLSGDEIYQHARAIVAAEMQSITYREFLPRLLGPNALPPYNGYHPDANPGISNVFATAAYRVGHTMLSSQLLRLDANGQEISAGHLDLAAAFFNPDPIAEHGIDEVLRGLADQVAQNVDNAMIDDVRNFLFGPPGSGGFDLAALNIQRGRDHGLASYNQVRTSVGRPPATGFAQITPDQQVRANLAAAYDNVDAIDAWVGMLAEPRRPQAFVGETVFRVLRNQFLRLRDGDRFWYQSYLPPDMVQLVEQQTLSMIIRRNTSVAAELQGDVFVVTEPCLTDFDQSGFVDIGDLLAVLGGWGPCTACPGDVDGDGQVGIFELLQVLSAWGACPGGQG